MKLLSVRRPLAVLAVLAIVLTFAVTVLLPAPAAEAQTVTYSTDLPSAVAPADGVTCIAIGTITNADDPSNNDDYCRPAGFSPINTFADCQGAAAFFGIEYAWSPSAAVCARNPIAAGAAVCDVPSVLVPADMILTDGSAVGFNGCVQLMLQMVSTTPPSPPPSMGAVSFMAETAATAACIDSAEVQDDPAAAGLGLGETFVGSNGNRFSITTGGPTCTLTGEGCDASLNLERVDDVKTCLATLAAAAAVTTAEAATDASPASSAVDADGELAHTGEEHERGAAFAGALFGTGLSVLAAARLYHLRTGRNYE